jgi:hypothetical protein
MVKQLIRQLFAARLGRPKVEDVGFRGSRWDLTARMRIKRGVATIQSA